MSLRGAQYPGIHELGANKVMRYLFAAIIFCGVGVAGAQELPSANFAPVALSEQRTQVWRVYNLNPDCTPADAIVGKVTKQGKGQVEFEENLGFSTYPPNTQKSRCNAQQTAGLSLFYTSPAGFRGTDIFGVEIVGGQGQSRKATFRITVK